LRELKLPRNRFTALADVDNRRKSHNPGRREVSAVSAHALYVTAAYAASAVVLAALIGWILMDGRARRRDLAALEAEGIRRRSDRAEAQQ
jgi:heme exporter protein D